MKYSSGLAADVVCCSADETIEEMLEFGMQIELAQLIAPALSRIENDPRGFRRALLEDEPRLAEILGVIRLS